MPHACLDVKKRGGQKSRWWWDLGQGGQRAESGTDLNKKLAEMGKSRRESVLIYYIYSVHLYIACFFLKWV